MENRKGAKSIKDLDKKVLKKLNSGEISSVNLVEILAMDFSILASQVGLTDEACAEKSIVKRMSFYGSKITDWIKYKDHPSDTVRGFAAYSLAQSNLNLDKKLEAMKHFANDSHFGVREWAWLAVRPELAANLDKSISILEKWSVSKQENIRRFSSEAIRPRGVWCSHIEELKKKPQLAEEILQNLKNDDCKYVQDSVGNWLNDASKSHPKWVQSTCKNWKTLKNKNTDYIIKKALRSIK